MTTHPNAEREAVAAALLAALVGLTALAALLNKVVGAAVTATGHPLLVGLVATVAAALAGLGRWLAGRMQERREEAADLLTAAAWRAEHMPHLAAQIDGARLDQDRAGVA